jgi:hypothetical protein
MLMPPLELLRVPGVYLASATFHDYWLLFQIERSISYAFSTALLVRIPTAPTISPVESVGLARRHSLISWRKRGVCAQVAPMF